MSGKDMHNVSVNCRGDDRQHRCGPCKSLAMSLLIVLCAGTQVVLAQDTIPAAAASYAQNCAVCHGEDATGAMPGTPDLLAQHAWAAYPNDELVKRIQEGIKTSASPSGMPPNAGNPSLTEVELRLAIEHLRRLLAAGK